MKFRKALAYILVLMLLFADLGAIAEGLTLKLPAALKTVGEEAFYGNTSLGKVVVPDGTDRIEARAFAYSSVSEVELPDTLTYIADDAFENCGDIAFSVPESCYAYEWCVRMGYIAPDTYFTNSTVWMRAGESVANPASAKGCTGEFTYESSHPEYVSVAADGTLTAHKNTDDTVEYVTITARYAQNQNLTATCRVYVDTFGFNADCLRMGGVSGGSADTFDPMYSLYKLIRCPESEDASQITFEVADSNVASVSADGLITAKAASGETMLTMRTASGLTASIPLKIFNLQLNPTIEPASGAIGAAMEGSFKIQYDENSYSSSYLTYDTDLLEVTRMDVTSDLHSDTVHFRVKGAVTAPVTTKIEVHHKADGALKGTYALTIYPAPAEGQVTIDSDSYL